MLTGEQGVERALRPLQEEGAREQGLGRRGGGRGEEHHVGHLSKKGFFGWEKRARVGGGEGSESFSFRSF